MMDISTTKTTFMLRTAPGINSVNLLGSWDNFKHAYPMSRDSRRSRGYWRGCPSFKNIICDGDGERIRAQPRDGELKMGGKYWYYYQLDGDMDYYNPAEPATTRCPFLPGQRVNILDVPFDLGPENSRGRSGSDSSVHFSSTCVDNIPVHSQSRKRAGVQARLKQDTSESALEKQSPGSTSGKPGFAKGHRRAASTSPVGTRSGFSRLLSLKNKVQAQSDSGSPSSPGPSSIRNAFAQFKAPISAASGKDDDRTRRVFFGKEKSSGKEGDMDIGAPVLLSRTDHGRHCVPLAMGNPHARSRSSSQSKSSVDSRESSPLRSQARHPPDVGPSKPNSSESAGEAAVSQRPSLERSLDHPLPPLPTGRSREPSPLRNAVRCEDSSSAWPAVHIPDNIVEELEEEEDDFNFQSSDKLNESDSEEKLLVALSPPPSQANHALSNANANSPPAGESANLGRRKTRSRSADLPTPLDLKAAPNRSPPTKSRFSTWSVSPTALSPSSGHFHDHTSPLLSPSLNSSLPTHSPHRLSGLSSLPSVTDDSAEEPEDEVASLPKHAFPAAGRDRSAGRGVEDGGVVVKSKRNGTCVGPTGFFGGYSLPEADEDDRERVSPLKVDKAKPRAAILGKSGSRATFGASAAAAAAVAGEGNDFSAHGPPSWDEEEMPGVSVLQDLLHEMGYLGDTIDQ